MIEPPASQVTLLHRISNIVSSDLSADEMLGEIIGITVQVTECDVVEIGDFLQDLGVERY